MTTIAEADLNAVSVFVTVVEAGSFTAAAGKLGLPKSSISRRVRQLEDGLGVQLLHRTTRHLALTDAGRTYFERVSSALAGVREAHLAAADLQDRPKGVVRLAASSQWSGFILAPIIALFVERYPDIRIELSLTDRAVDFMRDGFDLALTLGPLADSSLLVKTIESLESGLFASPDYLARHGTPTTVEELSAHAFVLSRPGLSNRLQLFKGEQSHAITVSGPISTDDRAFAFEAVRAGMGIGVLPQKGCAAHSGLVRVLPEYRLAGFTTHVVYPASRHIPQRVALFRDFLVEHLDTHRDGLCGQAARAVAKTKPMPPRAARVNGSHRNGRAPAGRPATVAR